MCGQNFTVQDDKMASDVKLKPERTCNFVINV